MTTLYQEFRKMTTFTYYAIWSDCCQQPYLDFVRA